MGTTLTGTTPQDTYDSLIKVTDNGPLTGSLKVLTDGLGNDSALALATGAASVTGTLAVTAGATLASASGNVGIGGTALTKLSVIDGTNTYCASFDGAGGTSLVAMGTTSLGPTIAGFTANFAAATNLIINPDGGNVGIGVTSAPTNKLVVKSGGYGAVASFLDAADNGFVFKADGFNGFNAIDQTQQLIMNFSGSEKYRFNTDGTLQVGSGIVFPSTQVASAGANTLDDYEEGTFSPTVEGSSTAGTATYSVQIGKYTKIGNQVSILIDLAWSGGTGTGILRIVGLPFTNVAFNTAGTIGFINDIALTASNYATTYVAPSSTRLDFVQSPTGGGSVTDVSYDAAGRLIISATYFNA